MEAWEGMLAVGVVDQDVRKAEAGEGEREEVSVLAVRRREKERGPVERREARAEVLAVGEVDWRAV
jgi:hypothetical protein